MSTDFVSKVRSQFPSLDSGYIFADNAGGSQCLKSVVDRISDYLLNTNVQLGADYSVSVESTNRVNQGCATAATLFNATSPSEIALGSSSTMLSENLARAMEKDFLDGEEIIITGEHEGTPDASQIEPKLKIDLLFSERWFVEEARGAQGDHCQSLAASSIEPQQHLLRRT